MMLCYDNDYSDHLFEIGRKKLDLEIVRDKIGCFINLTKVVLNIRVTR